MAEAHWRADGEPQLVLLHGAGLGRASWDAVVDRIPGFVRALALDLPGHNGVPGVAYDHEVVPRIAEYVAERLDALGIHRPHVVGHALGGAVALELARRVPVAAVTALCSAGFRAVGQASVCVAKTRAMLRVVSAFAPRTRARLLAKPWVRRLVLGNLSARPSALTTAVADVAAMVASDLRALVRYAGRYRFRASEVGDTTPVNLVWAAQDQVVPPADAVRARRVLPAARHLVVPDSGHLVMRDDPGATAAVIHACHLRLLRGKPRPTAGPA
ncbi:alpha/beta fold hydrolase [Saccharothrix variisporea]|uniref:Aminoacrylate hydrolase n=1 Tax=Saccharothrix variisporea TaxID=543527 RepID=A0A495X9A3_9PSEU|nr:alpha/beta fold hydrolase [Saccharothrix variisporea]RKT70199.1 aminoacrylate hydrolase [Saccharothrix variisporea]